MRKNPNFDHCLCISSDAKSKWLDAYHDPVASLYTFTQCITLSDIQADGDWKLIIADLGTGSFNMKLKVYKGRFAIPLSDLFLHKQKIA